MVWFAHQWLAHATYFPVAVAVMLLPYSRMDYTTFAGQQLLPYHMLGGALVNGIISLLLDQLGVGIAIPFALWAACGVLMAFTVRQVRMEDVVFWWCCTDRRMSSSGAGYV